MTWKKYFLKKTKIFIRKCWVTDMCCHVRRLHLQRATTSCLPWRASRQPFWFLHPPLILSASYRACAKWGKGGKRKRGVIRRWQETTLSCKCSDHRKMVLTRFANVPIDMFVFICFLPGFAVLALSVLELEQPIMKPSLFSFYRSTSNSIIWSTRAKSVKVNLQRRTLPARNLRSWVYTGFNGLPDLLHFALRQRYVLSHWTGWSKPQCRCCHSPPLPQKKKHALYIYIFFCNPTCCVHRAVAIRGIKVSRATSDGNFNHHPLLA